MKKLGLVLGSSGARGTSYVGFIKALEEHGIKPDFIAGSSMGSVVGACYAIGMTADQMEKEVLSLKASHLVDLSFRPISNKAVLRSKKLVKKLDTYFKGRTFGDTIIPFTAVSVDLLSGKVYACKESDNLSLGVAASSTIPAIFKPIKMNGMTLVDGGVLCRLPIKEVREMGAEVVVCLDGLGDTRELDKDFNIITVLMRSYEMMDGVLTNYRLNEKPPDLLIKPELGDMSQYKFKNFEFAMEQGYRAGIENIEKIKELIK